MKQRLWEPKFVKSFVILVNMQTLTSLTRGHRVSKSSSGCNKRRTAPPAQAGIFSSLFVRILPTQKVEDICLNFWLLNHRQFGKVFINKVRDPWNEFSGVEESEPCHENKWENNEICGVRRKKAPHIVIKLSDINFNFLIMTLIVFTPGTDICHHNQWWAEISRRTYTH